MTDLSQYESVGSDGYTDYYITDSDILLAIPKTGMVDTPETARVAADFINACARKAGKKLGTVVVMSNIVSQDAETRRVYQNLAGNGLYFGLALVVDNALSRALASFFLGFSRPAIPTQLFDTVEKGTEWLRTIRPG